jgi:aldose 1-epimerase
MQLKIVSPWGIVNGQSAQLFQVDDPKTGFHVEATDYGASLVRVQTPDRNGKFADINFGHNDATGYLKNKGYFGAMVGRVANRIAGGKFTLDGKEYKLFINNANLHSLHGGQFGFNQRFWTFMKSEAHGDEIQLKFQYISQDTEEGYPGTLTINLTYFIAPMKLGWEFKAKTDKPTIINLTNHAYWNLDGLRELIDGQIIQMETDRYMVGDSNNLITGEIKPVESMGFDLRQSVTFKEIFQKFGDIDNNFFLSVYTHKKKPQDVIEIAEIKSPKTGRWMKVYTSEPCCQIYSGNYMADVPVFDQVCRKHSAFCVETQRVPNAINIPNFQDMTILRPKQTYYHKTVHEFGVK